ncbi:MULTISPECIES: pyridoxamine 5'-phosphate oxidase family protein [Rhodomicrobium]|uniref:pyridoxamine 5'-phosphate oxidase family protein n=1 Tax=Rhodomicrobium TaxID=1068 RepID=UPI001483A20B|nr:MULTISPECIES: pyridoxamine 5'-phosphate oxidase family protein [Rhodomicrobium]
MAETDPHKHLYELVKDFHNVMFVTAKPGGGFHARPMAVAELKPDADAYFATSLDSPKIAEIEANPQAMISFQSATQFAYITGNARVLRDRALIDRLWSNAWQAWFPKGKDDPSLCIIKLEALEGEFWDNSGLHGLRYAFEGVKAILQGEKAETDAGQHAKVAL